MKYILYARKSTEQEERQAMSIESQENELLRMSEKFGIKIDKTYKESMSAKKAGRPIFNEMVEYIEKQKDCIVLAWKVDRLTRNIPDGGKIIELLEKGNIKEIRTIDKVIMDNPSDKFMLVMDFGVGKKYSDDLSVNVKRGNRAKMEKGGWPGIAPLGYLNDKANRSILVDTLRAPFIQKMFDLYNTGTHSLQEVANILYEQGFRTRQGRRVYKSKIHIMLSNPFYHGIMVREGKYYEGSHEPVISKQVFDTAQDVLFGKIRSQRHKHFFTFRGLLRCRSCGCALTASIHKGHSYYYCTNGKGLCVEHKAYMRSQYLEGIVATELKNIRFREEMIEMAYVASKKKMEKGKNFKNNVKENIIRQLESIAVKQSKLLDNQLSDLITDEVYKSKIKELNNQEIALKQQLKKVEKSSGGGYDTLEQTKEIFLTASKAKKEFINAKEETQREVLGKVLWNLEIKDKKIAQVSYKMPYQAFADTPKKDDFATMLERRDSNPRMQGLPHKVLRD
jgi:DNA invertase Pin-like site-specific DNA recombinase